MIRSKISSYLGFCIRSGSLIFGTDNIENKKKGVHLILVDEELGHNSLKVIIKSKERFACPLLIAEKEVLGEYIHRFGVKAIAVTDKNLASAIIESVESETQFKFYSGGNNGNYGEEI